MLRSLLRIRFFDSVCILNDSFDYFPLVSGSSTNLVFNLNIILRECFFRTRIESSESCKCVALAFLRTIYVCKITSYHMANKSPCQLVSRQLVYLKKTFFLFLSSHPHKCGSNALFIGVSVVRVGVFYPHTTFTPSFPCRNAQLIGGHG